MTLIEGARLDSLKLFLGQSLKVERVISLQGCIICSPEHSLASICYSPAGQAEHKLTGICEFCYDHISESSSSKHLSPNGMALIRLWLVARRARSTLRVSEADGLVCDAMIRQAFRWPSVYTHRHESQNSGGTRDHMPTGMAAPAGEGDSSGQARDSL